MKKIRLLTAMSFLIIAACSESLPPQSHTLEFSRAEQKPGQPFPLSLKKTAETVGLSESQIKVVKRELKGFESHDSANVKFNLEVYFTLQNQSQFEKLKAYYGSWALVSSSIQWRGTGEYRLEEFLPPSLQATYANRFVLQKQQKFFLTLAEAQKAPAGALLPEVIQFMTNCWTTVYSIMYTSLNDQTKNQFPVFMVNADIEKVIANDTYFRRIARLNSSSSQLKSTEAGLSAGDIVNIYHRNFGDAQYSSIVHSAIKIDSNLWFEKTAWASNVAYRFVTFDDIRDKYPDAEYDFRKPTGKKLPHPSDVFSIAAMYGKTGVSYPPILKNIISESPYPAPTGAEGFGIKDIPLQLGTSTALAQFSPQAFTAQTFSLPSASTRPLDFSDLQRNSPNGFLEDPYSIEIREAAVRGLVGGFPDGSFQPEGTVTRAQMVTMVLNALTKMPDLNFSVPTGTAGNPFTDVSSTYWAAARIVHAHKIGLVKGRTSSTFDPEGAVTKAEMAAIFKNTVDYVRRQRGLSGAIPAIAVPDAVTPDRDTSGHWGRDAIFQMYRFCWSASVSLGGRDSMSGMFRPDSPATRNYAAASTLRLHHCLARDKK